MQSTFELRWKAKSRLKVSESSEKLTFEAERRTLLRVIEQLLPRHSAFELSWKATSRLKVSEVPEKWTFEVE